MTTNNICCLRKMGEFNHREDCRFGIFHRREVIDIHQDSKQ